MKSVVKEYRSARLVVECSNGLLILALGRQSGFFDVWESD
jgi:hypothetical protein